MLLGCVFHHSASRVIIAHFDVNAEKAHRTQGGHLSRRFLCFLSKKKKRKRQKTKEEEREDREGKGGRGQIEEKERGRDFY